MRPLFARLHRWFGLSAALFLFMAGVTGAVISWDQELDAWLNPQLYAARTAGQPLPAADLLARIEAADPRVRVIYLPLSAAPGATLMASVAPRRDPASGRPFEPGYNRVAVDPATGEIQGRRQWGRVSLAREDLMPFLYKLHFSMHIPEAWDMALGTLVMGLVGIAWVFDTLIALWIAFPNWRAWRRSFAFRWGAGGHKLTFDLHRSGAVWVYLLVLMLAITSVAMNLRNEVMRPVVSLFSDLSPPPAVTAASPASAPMEPASALLPKVLVQARGEALRRGWRTPPGGVTLSDDGVWGVGFFEAGHARGDGGLGNPWLHVDARTGEVVGAEVPGVGSAGDIFMQSMFPLHSGRIIGLPGRILMSVMGLVTAMLAVTGVMIWVRKRRARAQQARRARLRPCAS